MEGEPRAPAAGPGTAVDTGHPPALGASPAPIPWEDAAGESMVRRFVETAAGVVLSPDRYLPGIAPSPVAPAIGFALVVGTLHSTVHIGLFELSHAVGLGAGLAPRAEVLVMNGLYVGFPCLAGVATAVGLAVAGSALGVRFAYGSVMRAGLYLTAGFAWRALWVALVWLTARNDAGVGRDVVPLANAAVSAFLLWSYHLGVHRFLRGRRSDPPRRRLRRATLLSVVVAVLLLAPAVCLLWAFRALV